MQAQGEEAVLLRVFTDEGRRAGDRPLHEAIVLRAREEGLAGATVLRGPLGFGAGGRIRSTRLLRLSEDLPVVVEIVDAAAKVESFLPWLREHVQGGLITLQPVRIVR